MNKIKNETNDRKKKMKQIFQVFSQIVSKSLYKLLTAFETILIFRPVLNINFLGSINISLDDGNEIICSWKMYTLITTMMLKESDRYLPLTNLNKQIFEITGLEVTC
ncbi:hypothetical protein BpHYR1_038653 [Brachionus plicatilis]|uniref:Uncharacterized protein n=1 Tax=Brachionus plicatilis TaxID=10195 RepID=A0A3M7RKA6_BRAPC|nr:hypothetical protein BpHYR1_038653 [Brachionus plicatilis]